MNVFKFYYDYQGWEVVKKKNYSFTTINGSCVIFCYYSRAERGILTANPS